MNALLIVSFALVAACSGAPQFLAAPWAGAYPYAGAALATPYLGASLIKVEDDGQYRTGLLDSAIDLRGQYLPQAEGRYLAGDEGQYRADDEGSYKADNEGAYKPDAEGQYDAASAHAVEALSEDGSYKGEPLSVALSAGIVKALPAPIAHAPIATPFLRSYATPFAVNPLGYRLA